MEFVEKDKYKDCSGIYAIENKMTGEAYVGQTKMRFVKRYWHHCWKLSHNDHDNHLLQSDYNIVGDSCFRFVVLAVMDKNDNMDDEERSWIAFYRRSSGSYNIQDGGHITNLSSYISKDARKVVGEKNRNRILGTKLPESTKAKMKESAHRGSDNKEAKLSEADVMEITNLIMSGVSDRDIANRYGVTRENIYHIRKGHTWRHITGFNIL